MIGKFFYYLYFISRTKTSGELNPAWRVQGNIVLINFIYGAVGITIINKIFPYSFSSDLFLGLLLGWVLLSVAPVIYYYKIKEAALEEYLEYLNKKQIDKGIMEGHMLLYFFSPIAVLILSLILLD
jgi:hypothetical protein